MSDQNYKPGLKTGFWVFMLVVGTVFLGMVGGAIVGGLAGYTVALNQKDQLPAISQPIPVSASPAVLAPVLQPAASDGEAAPISENEALIAAVEQVKAATVTVLNYNQSGVSSGSGVIIDAAGYLVTNDHVVDGASKLEVILALLLLHLKICNLHIL